MQQAVQRQHLPPVAAIAVNHRQAGHRLASRAAMLLGAIWLGVLLGTLLGLGRVPWPEALAWSCLSAVVLWRGLATSFRTTLDHLLASVTIELGMADPQGKRGIIAKALVRRGYHCTKSHIQGDTFQANRFAILMRPLKIAWSGPGAIVEGPRLLVRLVARIAVG